MDFIYMGGAMDGIYLTEKVVRKYVLKDVKWKLKFHKAHEKFSNICPTIRFSERCFYVVNIFNL